MSLYQSLFWYLPLINFVTAKYLLFQNDTSVDETGINLFQGRINIR